MFYYEKAFGLINFESYLLIISDIKTLHKNIWLFFYCNTFRETSKGVVHMYIVLKFDQYVHNSLLEHFITHSFLKIPTNFCFTIVFPYKSVRSGHHFASLRAADETASHEYHTSKPYCIMRSLFVL